MSAYIRLYGHKHGLSDDVLAIIANAVIGRDDELAMLIDAYRNQESFDDIGSNPLMALDTLGRLILNTLQREGTYVSVMSWRLAIQEIGGILVVLAKGWAFYSACADGMIDELRKARCDLHIWVGLLKDKRYINGADWISGVVLPQLEAIISVLEDHSNDASNIECASNSA